MSVVLNRSDQRKYNTTLLNKTDTEYLWKRVRKQYPSDVVKCDQACLDKLQSITKRISGGDGKVPNDLIYADTLPLTDMIIAEAGSEGKARIAMFNCENVLKAQVPEKEWGFVAGVVCISLQGQRESYALVPVMVASGENGIIVARVGYVCGGIAYDESDLIEGYEESLQLLIQNAKETCASVITAWYGIQIALLHPTVKEMFRNPRTTILKDSETDKKRSKSKVRYVKEHIINADELDKLLYGESDKRTIKRHALVWYVIGHWRTLRNGKIVFVKPYWKGALRELKKPIPEREREIVQGSV